MDSADFYSINGLEVDWIGSGVKNCSPYEIPYDILIQSDSLNYILETDMFLSKIDGGYTKEWPHIWPDSQMTDYVYYFFESLNKVLFSLKEDDHKRLYDPISIKKGRDLITAKRINIKRKFPIMRSAEV